MNNLKVIIDGSSIQNFLQIYWVHCLSFYELFSCEMVSFPFKICLELLKFFMNLYFGFLIVFLFLVVVELQGPFATSVYTHKMQGLARLVQAQGRAVTGSVLQHVRVSGSVLSSGIQTRTESGQPSKEGLEEHGFESTTIQDILKEKGQKADGSWLWCSVDDTVYDAVKSVRILFSIMH